MKNAPEKSENSTAQSSNTIDLLAQERTTESNAIEIPSISLPKGGGALKGIDEKFQVNSANGTAGFSIPLPLSPGRNGFSPSLSLDYNSGSGNSPYGLGWSVGYPSIQRKTDKKLPRYRKGLEEDVFMLSGAEDLVPYLEEANAEWKEIAYPNNGNDGYSVKRYRPRIEGGFAKIEKITHSNHGVYWKVTTRENVATIFGRDEAARIADPDDKTKIFEWLPEFSYDDKGNWIKYHYKKEDVANVPNRIFEKNRISGLAPFTNTYLKRIKYGNRQAYYPDTAKAYDPSLPVDDIHFFELIMDYGEHTSDNSPHLEINDWGYRADAFSSYRSGFEIRTSRLCKRILMFHHFKDEKQTLGYEATGFKIETPFGENYLVRSLNLNYEKSSINSSDQTEVTYLKSVVQTGYIRKADGSYSQKSLPPLEFSYQTLHWDKTIKTVGKESIVNTPVGLTNNYQWVDLYGEGISGILTEQGEGWYYKSNLGDIEDGEVAFTVAQQVAPRPSFLGLSNGTLSLQDLAANGEKQIVVNSVGAKGYFELTQDNNWKPFIPFEQLANIDFQDPNTRLLDLNGDGQPDLVMTEENVFVWYAADGKRGHLAAEFAHKTFDEEQGPAIVFADAQQTIFLADVSGDGLTDIVRIRNGEICYWANMGYAKFSAKVSMDNAPVFDHPDAFNPQYLHLTDVSGTGATDIIYLGKNQFKAFINLSGNGWSEAHQIEPFPDIDSNTRLSVIDLLGSGTSCIVWSSDLPAYVNAPMRYIDLMGGKKPHVMIKYVNNMGLETNLEYKSSTYYYLKDKLAGNPWVTKLPFPVQVISKQIVEEKITDVRFTTEYTYHHGYFDHPEREFRGFGMVEQLDSEHYAEWIKKNGANQLEKAEALYQKPVLTKTWFHTGAFLDRERMLNQFKNDYWFNEFNRLFPNDQLSVTEPALVDAQLQLAVTIQDQSLLDRLDVEEWREAMRACKGMMLRQEVFALDAPENPTEEELKLQSKPYTVATHNCNVQLIQPRGENGYGVFIVTESEVITISYERDEQDYRLAHSLNTKIDELGNVIEKAAVVYGRNQTKANADFLLLSSNITDFSEDVLDDSGAQKTQLQNAFSNNLQAAKTEQTKTHIIYTQNSFAKYSHGTNAVNDIDLPHAYRLRVPYEVKTYEITGLQATNNLFKLNDLADVLSVTIEIEYHDKPTTGIQSRLIEHVQTKYFKDDLSPLGFGLFDTLGLPYENYQFAYTKKLAKDIYSKQDGTELLADGTTVSSGMEAIGKYTNINGKLWIRSGIVHFKTSPTENITNVKKRFFSPLAFEDPLGTTTTVIYDKETFAGTIRNNDGYYLFVKSTTDAVDNKSQIDIFNYRTLSPARMIDINANPSAVILDELGLVKAVAVEGNGVYADATQTAVNIVNPADSLAGIKEYTEASELANILLLIGAASFDSTKTTQLRVAGKNLLQQASSRFVYDFDSYKVTGKQPAMVASITREEHHADNNTSKMLFGFEYSDGAGNLAMVKAQAEPGKAFYLENGLRKEKHTGTDLRWIGNGRTVLNNKGNPVKQYEPYFSTNFGYEDDTQLVETGVTPILYYDALSRPVKTEFPDGTFTKTEFDSWKQLNFDQNDTVLESAWFTQRINNLIDTALVAQGKDPTKEKQAAQKVENHANTPASLYLDSLGRPVLSIDHNGEDGNDNDRLYTTFIHLDVEGNARAVIDSRGNTVMAYKYDMLGHRVYQKSMDAGERWFLNNLLGNPIHRWDSRDQIFSFTYDAIQRPESSKVQGGDGPTPLNHIYEHILYGEGQTNAVQHNLRGQAFQRYDTAGRVQVLQFDFKGNPLETTRELNANYKEVPNWIPNNLNNSAQFDTNLTAYTTRNEYDALSRPMQTTTPDGSISKPSFNAAGLLEKVLVKQPGISEKTFVKNIDYNAKRQREKIVYGDKNGHNLATTTYRYDDETFRLLHLKTIKGNGDLLQDLYYTYDPVGNISEIEDKALPLKFFNNQKIEGKGVYTYDALYRLTEAKGREHAGQAINFGICDNWKDNAFIKKYSAGDDMAWRTYTQKYSYDPVGNILQMDHKANLGDWKRIYTYETQNNRLGRTQINGQTYDYTYHPQHGFITSLPHLQLMQWNFRDELQAVAARKVCTGFDPETTYYVYDSDGQRIRKITENNAGGSKKEERIYLGEIEVYKKHSGNHSGLERTTLHVMDDTRRIAMIDTRNAVNDTTDKRTVRFQFGNHLGSACLELDDTGNGISYEEYHPYGTTAYQAVNKDIKAAAKRYRYTEMERDVESGFNYHSARYYLPWLGRWLSTDPIGVKDGFNLYRVNKNNPVRFKDISGQATVDSVALERVLKLERLVIEERAKLQKSNKWRNSRPDDLGRELERRVSKRIGEVPGKWASEVTEIKGKKLVGTRLDFYDKETRTSVELKLTKSASTGSRQSHQWKVQIDAAIKNDGRVAKVFGDKTPLYFSSFDSKGNKPFRSPRGFVNIKLLGVLASVGLAAASILEPIQMGYEFVETLDSNKKGLENVLSQNAIELALAGNVHSYRSVKGTNLIIDQDSGDLFGVESEFEGETGWGQLKYFGSADASGTGEGGSWKAYFQKNEEKGDYVLFAHKFKDTGTWEVSAISVDQYFRFRGFPSK